MKTSNAFFRRLAVFALLAAGLALAGCGGSGSGSGGSAATDCIQPSPQDANGCTYVAITDAPGDFLTYTVNVTSLSLTRQDGTVVQMLPNTTTVDFAQYSDLTEFLSLASMPPGDYVNGTITLDYSNANIEVQDASGNAVKVTPVDQNGNPITGSLTLNIKLDGQRSLLLVPGVPRLLRVDFNLNASNIVNLGNDTVAVQPFLVADVDPALNKVQRVRGPLASVNTGNDSFTLGLRPFYTPMGGQSNPFGQVTVYTNGNTVYEISQQGYVGASGLAALQQAGATTAVIARGTFDFGAHQFVAAEVYAGSSVPGGTLDWARGTVLARSGTTLTLRGVTLIRAGGSVVFNDNLTVNIGANTRVHEQGDPTGTFDISDISVGQWVGVAGTLTNTNPISLALDATNGFVRLRYTRVDATVNSLSLPNMLVNVQSFEGRPVSLFNFNGTGNTPANPASYAVNLNGLSGSFNSGDPVAVWGFVAPFGSAGGPPTNADFTAKSVADFVNANAQLAINWTSGSAAAFSMLDANSGIAFNFSGVGTLDDLRRGGVITALNTMSPAPTVVGNTLGVFAILQNVNGSETVQVHVDFAGFVSDLSSRLGAGAKVLAFYGNGGFNGTTNVLTANKLAVIVQ